MIRTKRFFIRTNCEYSLLVEAPDRESALKEAEKTDLSDWDQSWAEFEAEEEPDGPLSSRPAPPNPGDASSGVTSDKA